MQLLWPGRGLDDAALRALGEQLSPWVLLSEIDGSVGAPMTSAVRGRRRRATIDPFSPLTIFAAMSILEFVGVYLYVTLSTARGADVTLPLSVDVGTMSWALGIFAVYAAAWLFGYQGGRHRGKRSWTVVARAPRASWGGVFWLNVIAFGGLIALYSSHPGRSQLARSALTEGVYGQVFFVGLTVTLVMSQYLVARACEPGPYQMRRILASIGYAALYAAFLWGLEGRGRAVLPILSAVIILHFRYRRWSIARAAWIIAPVLVVLVAVPFWSRQQAEPQSPLEAAFSIEQYRNFDNLYNLAVVVDGASRSEFDTTFGSTLVCDLGADLGIVNTDCRTTRELLMHDLYGFELTTVGYPVSKPGEFYSAFGLLGVVLGGLVLGRVSRWAYIRLALEQRLGALSVPLYIAIVWKAGWANPANYFAQEQVLLTVTIIVIGGVALSIDGMRRVSILRERTRVPLAQGGGSSGDARRLEITGSVR
jgi:oligosaccharide repeat unit polymerase